MARYFIELSYNGKNYHGWQVQNNAITVQSVLDNALSTVLTRKTETIGCGRTDAGVHAKQFYAHFDAEANSFDKDYLAAKLNRFLPKDIAIHGIFQVGDDVNSRFAALSRTYQYFVHTEKSAFLNDSSYFVFDALQLDLMNEAAKILYNHIDFSCFSKLHSQTITNNCTLTYANWEKVNNQLVFTVKANRFLRNMVRAIVGTLLDIGRGKLSISDFEAIILSKNRCNAGYSVPAHALFLTTIEYPEEIFQFKN